MHRYSDSLDVTIGRPLLPRGKTVSMMKPRATPSSTIGTFIVGNAFTFVDELIR